MRGVVLFSSIRESNVAFGSFWPKKVNCLSVMLGGLLLNNEAGE